MAFPWTFSLTTPFMLTSETLIRKRIVYLTPSSRRAISRRPSSAGRISGFAHLSGPQILEFIVSDSKVNGHQVREAFIRPELSCAFEASLEL